MIATLDDVVAQILPLAPGMSERDISDILLAIHADPSVAPDLLADYQSANLDVPADVLATVWKVLQAAAGIASVITSIAGAVALA